MSRNSYQVKLPAVTTIEVDAWEDFCRTPQLPITDTSASWVEYGFDCAYADQEDTNG